MPTSSWTPTAQRASGLRKSANRWRKKSLRTSPILLQPEALAYTAVPAAVRFVFQFENQIRTSRRGSGQHRKSHKKKGRPKRAALSCHLPDREVRRLTSLESEALSRQHSRSQTLRTQMLAA